MVQQLKERLRLRSQPVPPGRHLGLDWRPITAGDTTGIYELLERSNSDDHELLRSPKGFLEEVLTQTKQNDLHLVAVVGIDSQNQVGAFAQIQLYEDEQAARVRLIACVDPKRRGQGIGHLLLNWQLERAKQMVLEVYGPESNVPVCIEIYVPAHQAERRRMLLAAGFSTKQSYSLMRYSITQGPQLPQLPDLTGITIINWDTALEASANELHFRSFLHGHWNNSSSKKLMWDLALQKYDPRFSIMALDDNRQVVGYLLACSRPLNFVHNAAYQGFMESAAVAQNQRRQGIALAMAAKYHENLAQAGIEYAGLDIDSNDTFNLKAVAIAFGYEEIGTQMNYSLEL